MNSKDDILDNGFGDKTKKSTFKFAHWIGLFLLCGVLGYVFIGFIADIKLIFAILLLITSTIITILNAKLGLKFLLIPLILGSLSLITFSPVKFQIGPGVNHIGLRLDLFLLFILIIHIYLNDKYLTKFLKSILNKEKSIQETSTAERKSVDRFKNKYSLKGIQELEKIAKNQKMVPAAITAALELIEDKSQ